MVDFDRLGGGDQTRCAPGDPASGVEALRAAGFQPTRAAQEPGYFVCRIDGKPADDPCQRASPEDAYWSYWHGEPGGTWTFSNAGAASHDPQRGTVEGWAFGAGEPPSTPPARRQQAEPTAAAPAPAPSTPAPRRTTAAPAAPSSSAQQSAPAPTARPSPPASPSVPAPADSAPPASATPSPSGTDEVLTVDDPGSPDEGSSPLLGVLLAVAVVAGLGSAAAFQARRRR